MSNQPLEVQRIVGCVESFGASHGLPKPVVGHFSLVLDELLTNIVSYGYRDEDCHTIGIRLRLKAGCLVAEIVDDGVPYDPLQTPPPNLAADLDERRIGGLGVHIVRTLMDSVEYLRKGDKNHLTIAKAIV